jgi:hypothetical protein
MVKFDSNRRCGQLLARARGLARTGQYPDHQGVVAELQRLPDFHIASQKIQQASIQHQLDRLCSMARQKQGMKAVTAARA